MSTESLSDIARELFCEGYALAIEQAIQLLRAAKADEESVALLVTMRTRAPAVHAAVAIAKASKS